MHIYGGGPGRSPQGLNKSWVAAGRKVRTVNQPALSVQLYAVKDQLTDDLDGTLARLYGMGLRQVEAFNFVASAPELAEAFTRHGGDRGGQARVV
jgi:hypothetical protein